MLDSLTTFFLGFSSLSTVSIFLFVGFIDAPLVSLLCFFYGTYAWSFSTSSNFGCSRTVACSSPIFWTSGFQFHFRCYPTRDQLKLKTSSLHCWLQNQFKFIIMLPEIKGLLEGGQKLYTKNSTAQRLVFIQIQDGYRTREKLVTRVPVYFYQYIAYLEKIHWPLKFDRCFKSINSTFSTLQPNLISTLGFLGKSNEGGAWLPQES